MKIYDTFCEMQGVTPEKVMNPLSALEIFEGQVSLVHHIMAFEEANPGSHPDPETEVEGQLLAYFLGAVPKGQLMVMKQLGDESYAASLADQNCWQVRTSKRLTYTLRHNHDLSLGRYNDALFENIDRELQAFRWAPHKILGFLLGNTKTRFAVHVQLRRLHYDDIPSIDWYISLSDIQGQGVRDSRSFDSWRASVIGHQKARAGFGQDQRGRSVQPHRHPHGLCRWHRGTALWDAHAVRQVSVLLQCKVREAPFGRLLALPCRERGSLCYQTIPASYLTFHTRPPHEKDPAGRQWDRRAREEGVPVGTGSSEQKAPGGSPMREGPEPSSSSAARGSAFAEGPDAETDTPTFNLDDLRRVIQEQELAEQTESVGRRVPQQEGILEVDAKISLERERILEQEALNKKVNANPWFIYDHGITRLKVAYGGRRCL